MKNKKIYYYRDELNDEFSGANITPRVIDKNYKFIHKNPLWNFWSFLIQNFLSMPIKVLYGKLKFRIKYVGREKLKSSKDDGYFIYVNHTQVFGDVFFPSLPVYPKRNHFIVNPENVSMPFFGNSIQLFGAIPVPNKRDGMKNFLEAIKYHINKKHPITIYPEAHIWPYYTKIRPFKAVSFKYPVELGKAVYCMTNTYKAYGKNKDKAKIVTYIDGPFFADKKLSPKEQKQDLRDRVYECMCNRSKNSDIEIIKYVFQDDAFGDTSQKHPKTQKN